MRLPTIDPTVLAAVQTAMPAIWLFLRSSLGWVSIAIGVLGTILPILPGLPFLILGSYLLGHRDRRLRWVRVHIKLLIRHAARSDIQLIRFGGRLARQTQYETLRIYRTWRTRRLKQPPRLKPPTP